MSMFRRRLLMYQALMNKSDVINYPGLIAAWSAKGKTNDDADRAILKDLTGNGHDISLNGFAFSEMSGYGGYDTNFTNKKDWTMNNDGGDNANPDYNVNYTSTYFKIQKTDGGLIGSTNVLRYKANKVGKFRFKINTDGTDLGIKQVITSIEGKVGVNVLLSNINSNEVYEIDLPTYSVEEYKTHQVTFNTKEATFLECWMLPEYPDALVFDGVNDYGVNENMPILTDYTIIAKRYRIGDKGCVIAKTGYPTSLDSNNWDFILEGGSDYVSSTWSLSVSNKKNIIYEDITFQTKNSYNGETISYLLSYKGKANCLTIGKLYLNDSRLLRGAFYSAYLFDRSLDEQEIKSFIRKYIDPEYLLPSEKIPTPDCYYDFSKGNNDDETRDTIKDYSGNGNDAVAHNFAWNGMSGYGDNLYGNYKYHFDTLGTYQNIVSKTPVIGNLKFKVTGLTDYFNKTTNYIELTLTRVSDGGTDFKKIKEDGEHNIELPTSKYSEISIRSGGINIEDDACNIDIEMLPEYPGALVFDGTDDYVSLDAFDSGFKTVFIVCTFFSPDLFIYDQRNNTRDNENAVTTNNGEPCYYGRNKSGITYINGLLNDYKPGLENSIYPVNTKGEKHLITCAFINGVNTTTPTIANRYDKGYQYLKMNLYKFLGFKEALTEEQIQAVIKKYNLLDGVDEIEVS